MPKILGLAGALAAALCAAAGSAANIPTTVSATGSFSGDLNALNDGIIPANGSVYDAADKVSFTSTPASFRFDFGGLFNIDGLLATVDNNDQYTFAAYNGANFLGNLHILPGEGTVGFGVETFSYTFSPLAATHFIVTATGGDSRYSIGEVQFSGNALGAVPEPTTWALMIAGFATVGGAIRRKKPAVVYG